MHALTLETCNLTRRFGAFTALDGVSLAVRPGTVHALLGENGAGKSTLVKCVVGYQRPSEGSVLVDGRERDIASPTVARAMGIGMVYQHFTVVPGMSVAETHYTVELIRRIAANLTILIVEHDMEVVMGLASAVTVLHYGEILAEGSPAEIQANARVQEVYLKI